jgi:hypothetical protein
VIILLGSEMFFRPDPGFGPTTQFHHEFAMFYLGVVGIERVPLPPKRQPCAQFSPCSSRYVFKKSDYWGYQ